MTKIGRNDPCPCGSGKKYKKCCMNKNKEEEIQTYQEDEEDISFRNPVRNDYKDDDFDDLDEFDESMSPEDEALCEAIDEVVDLLDRDKTEESARKFLEVTANIQKMPDNLDWDISDICTDIVDELRQKNPELAIEVLRRNVILDPKNSFMLERDIAEIMISNGKVEEGFSILHRLANENPKDIWCWTALGRNYVDVKDYNKAKEYLAKAVQVGKEHDKINDENDENEYYDSSDIGTAYIHLFDVYRAMGMVEEAIESWENAAYHYDYYKSHVIGVCDMLIEKNDLERAKSFSEKIINQIERYYYLGKIEKLQGNEKEGIRHWNAILNREAGHNIDRWSEVALRLGKSKLVIKILPSFLKKYPANWSCRALLSIAYILEKRPEAAKKVLQEAPDGIDIPDDNLSLYKEIFTDDSIRDKWLSILDTSK